MGEHRSLSYSRDGSEAAPVSTAGKLAKKWLAFSAVSAASPGQSDWIDDFCSLPAAETSALRADFSPFFSLFFWQMIALLILAVFNLFEEVNHSHMGGKGT